VEQRQRTLPTFHRLRESREIEREGIELFQLSVLNWFESLLIHTLKKLVNSYYTKITVLKVRDSNNNFVSL